MSLERADAVIVGAGAGGGVVAKELALAGLKVVLLERGPLLKAEDYRLHDEQIAQPSGHLFPPSCGPDNRHPREFRLRGEKEFQRVLPQDSRYSSTGAVVGGGQFTYGVMMWRRPPIEFRMKSEYGRVTGTTLEDWPFRFEELEPFYAKAEYELGVSGEKGPFDGPRSKPYPLPPFDLHPGDLLIQKAATKLGYHPFRVPLGTLSQPYGGRGACIQHPCCNMFICEVGVKSNFVNALMPQTLASGNCRLVPDAMVKEITVDSRGKPEGVSYFDKSGQLIHQPAKIIVLAASATETPRLLLNSKSRWFPRGMGNANDWVGRNFMGHLGPSVVGIFEETANTGFGPGPGVAIDDFYGKNPGFTGGGVFYSRTESMPIDFCDSRPPGSPAWGRSHKEFQRKYFRRFVRFWVPGEDMPVFENRIEVSPSVRDAWGIPVSRITHGFHSNDFVLFDFFRGKMEQLMKEAGAVKVWSSRSGKGGIGSHQNGTCRMGKDPQTSVVNRYGQSHEVDNLFIADGSLFVTSGGRNPALTIQALAYWVSDYIVREWKGGSWRS